MHRIASRDCYEEVSVITIYLADSWIIGIKRVVSEETLAYRALKCMMMFKRRLLAQKVQEDVALPTDLDNAPLQASPNRYPCNPPSLTQAEQIHIDYKIEQRTQIHIERTNRPTSSTTSSRSVYYQKKENRITLNLAGKSTYSQSCTIDFGPQPRPPFPVHR